MLINFRILLEKKYKTFNLWLVNEIFYFQIGEDTFPLGEPRDGIPPFPMPYDVPLTPYGTDDKPFLMDYLHM